MKKILFCIVTCLAFFSASGQNDVQYTHFIFNKMAYNAAFTGSEDALQVGAIYRNQWSGIDGAPQTLNVHAQMPFAKNRSGIGLSLTTDEIGMARTTFVELSYAYRIPMGDKLLAIGMNGRVEHSYIDWTQARGNDQLDGSVPGDATTVFTPNFGFGFVFSAEQYFVGASINQLLNNGYYQSNDVPGIEEIKMRTIYLTGGLTLRLSPDVDFLPAMLVSYNPNAPFDLDVNAGFSFMKTFYAGVTYRLDDSADLLAMYQVNPQLRIGAAYDFTLSELNAKTTGSFEVLAQYTFRYDDMSIKNIRFF